MFFLKNANNNWYMAYKDHCTYAYKYCAIMEGYNIRVVNSNTGGLWYSHNNIKDLELAKNYLDSVIIPAEEYFKKPLWGFDWDD